MKKQEKGITLIALIITIVVLLILAVVAINSIQDGGILSYANNAASAYNQAQVNEQTTINGYTDWLKWQSCSEHDYSNGVCSKCGYPCSHKGATWEGSVCSICGSECRHYEVGFTTIYEYQGNGTHTEDYACKVCSWTEGGDRPIYDCTFGNDNVCDLCNGTYDCSTNRHIFGDDSICDLCKFQCTSHKWDDYYNIGYCSVCNYKCLHENKHAEYYYGGVVEDYMHDCVEFCNDCNWYSTEPNPQPCKINEDGYCEDCNEYLGDI